MRNFWSNCLFVGVVAVFLGTATRVLADRQEYAIKAAFLLNISQFVEWPEEAFAGGGPFVIGVLERNPFGPLLESLVRGQTVNKRPIVVRYARTWEEAEALGCHLLFIPEGASRDPLTEARMRHTLLVSDSPDFAAGGGMVGLVRSRDRVRLEINRKALTAAGLRASSRLLGVATIVDPDNAVNELPKLLWASLLLDRYNT